MGKRNRQRRAAKKRRAADRARRPPRTAGAGGDRASGSPPAADELLRAAAWAWDVDPARHAALLAALVARPDEALSALDQLMDEALEQLWSSGWTPADVAHVVLRRLSGAHGDLVARLAVADGRARLRRGQTLHPRWESQLAALADRCDEDAPALDAGSLALGISVLCVMVRLPAVPLTVPAPGAAAAADLAGAGLDARMLAKVRALLAKAERTEFDDEAEALTAKAQELIARHAIDEALLHAADIGEPSVRRIHIDDPYADAKAALLSQVAAANRCRMVHTPEFGWVTAFGYDRDLDAVELLSASLLAQAVGAMARHGASRDALGRSRTRSFRRSFLFGFASRIGQRLRQATDSQVAAAAADHGRLLPVLAARDERLKESVSTAFPRLVSRSTAISHAGGWAAGQAAAELADLTPSVGVLRE